MGSLGQREKQKAERQEYGTRVKVVEDKLEKSMTRRSNT